MKMMRFLIAVAGLLLLSCSRQNDAGSAPFSLAGNWRMISVTDNATGSFSTKPDGTGGDVDISFAVATDTSGILYGNTPSNDIAPSDYTTDNSRQLQVLFLDMTKVAETSWGSEFVDNIRSAKSYNFADAGALLITTEKKTLMFKRL